MKDFFNSWIVLFAVTALCGSFLGCGGKPDERRAGADRPVEDSIAQDPSPDVDDGNSPVQPSEKPNQDQPDAQTALDIDLSPSPAISSPAISSPAISSPAISSPAIRSFSPPVAIRKPTAAPSIEKQAITAAPPTPVERVSDGPVEVEVFYGTDRNRQSSSLGVPSQSKIGLLITGVLFAIAAGLLVFNRLKSGFIMGAVATSLMASLFVLPGLIASPASCYYGTQRGEFVRGIASVTVPASHVRGMVERPSILRLEFSEDENKHIILAKAQELPTDEFYSRMSTRIGDTEEKDLLVFIHGYNVDFDSAIRRTAQIATDLGIEGVPVCYSWPSQGSLVGYTVDENNVVWTVPHLRDFLLELAEHSQAKSINIISHSMGNRAMAASLGQISRQRSKGSVPLFDQVVLAAPDVDADHFRNELAPLLADVARHVTLYASSDDQALVASKHLHGGYARAGESGVNLVVVEDIETIDVSGIDLSLLGHSYYGNSESILRDLWGVVREQLPAAKRTGLILRRMNDASYWMIPRPQLSELNDLPVPEAPTKTFAPSP